MKPFSQAAENNRLPILAVLREVFADRKQVLEVGSGTGQHAAAFAKAFPNLVWQSSDRPENHQAILAWTVDGPPNLLAPLSLDVLVDPWPAASFDAVYSANTVHIMGEAAVRALFAGVGALLPRGGLFALYGPFIVPGRQTAASNTAFDRFLRERDPASGLRALDWLDELAKGAGLIRESLHELPANNDLVVWRKA